MPSYKVTYFDARGRAELTRLALVAAGKEFEDVRLNGDKWAALKPQLSQGKLPILEVDGKIIPQSGAMVRYVARECECGLYGANNLEMTEVDVVIETIEDFNTHLIKMFFEKDETKKAELSKTLFTETLPTYLTIFKKTLGDRDWMVGSKMTIADLAVFNIFEFIAKAVEEKDGTDIFDKIPTLKSHLERVASVPKIKEWLQKRPKTDH